MHKQSQHAVIRMNIKLKLLQKYHQRYIPETGTQLKYDIKQLKLEPAKIERWYNQRIEENAKTHDWEQIKTLMKSCKQGNYRIKTNKIAN